MADKLVVGQYVRWLNDSNNYQYGIIERQVPNTELFVIVHLYGQGRLEVHKKRLETGRWESTPRWVSDD